MIRYFWKTLLAHFRKGRSLYALSALGVALGVASVVCIQIINRNALGAFEGSVRAVSGDADLSVVGRTPAFPESLYVKVQAESGVASAWPLYRVHVALAGRGDFFLEVLGVDLFAPVPLPWEGGAQRIDNSLRDLAGALGRPGWVAVTPSLAGEMGWSVGDAVAVTSGSRRVRLVVGALVDFQRVSPLASRKMAVMDIAQAQGLLGRRGEVHQIDVRAAKGTDLKDLASRLRERLGPSVQVLTPEQREKQAEGLLSAFRLNLTALSLISVFVGAFLIYSSTQAALVRRRAEFGLLRSVGATRKQTFGLILGEVVLLALLGVAMGLPLGYWAAATNVKVVSATLSNLYLLNEIEALRVPLWVYGLAVLVGVGGAVLGAALPALDVSRRDTRSLLAAFTLHEQVSGAASRLFLAGGGLMLIAGGWFWGFGWAWRPGGFVLGIALLIGIPLVTPFLVRQVCGRVRVRGFGLSYSLKSLGTRVQTAFAVSALAVAVSMLIGITLMIGSFRRTVEVWLTLTAQADVYITTESWTRAGAEATLSPALAESIAAHPGVRAVDRLRQFFVYSGERRIVLGGVEMGLPDGEGRFPLLAGERGGALRQVREAGAVLISEPLARKAGLGPGDWLPVYGPKGEVRFRVAGVYYDYTTEGGAVAMDLRTMERAFGPGEVNNMSLYLSPGFDPERVVDELRARFAGYPLEVRSNRRLREEVFAIFDQTFAVTQILRGMSLLIAVCGITLTLLVLARERVSELALYRALGTQRRQVFRVFVGEGLSMGVMGLGIGVVGGFALAMILIFAINRAYFGWTIQVYWPWWQVAGQAATILTAAVMASLYPALRASQAPAGELSRDDI
ncbi:MAG: FtsX-like permease family protein [Candidatus Latescibacteria bacterium]|nr:FtsX-like permease family protein [Candidatus Latescibacterota bacterium]